MSLTSTRSAPIPITRAVRPERDGVHEQHVDEALRGMHESVVRRCDDASMPRWVRSYWDEEDITFLWEVRDDGWIARAVELAGPKRRPQAAAALDELLRTRDTGGIRAVQAYETRYGVVSDKPIEDWDFPHEDISHPTLNAHGLSLVTL